MKTKTEKMTRAKLATILGVSRQLVAHHVKTGKAPPLHDVQGWIEHLAVVGREGSAPAKLREAIAKEKLAILRAVRLDKERANMAKDGKLIDADLVRTFMNDIVGNVFCGELERLAQEFPATLKGKSEVEIAMEVGRQKNIIKAALDKRLALWESQGGEPK